MGHRRTVVVVVVVEVAEAECPETGCLFQSDVSGSGPA